MGDIRCGDRRRRRWRCRTCQRVKKSKPLLASKLKSKRDDWPSLVASSNFFLLLQKPPTPLSTPYLFTFCLQNIIKKSQQSILGKIIIQDQVLLSPPHYQQLL